MSTRGVCGFKLNGEIKAMYNHSDSYPDGGLGEDIANFIVTVKNLEKIKDRVSKVVMVEQDRIPNRKLQKKYEDYSNNRVGEGNGDWYCTLHKLQGVGIVKGICSGEIQHMIDDKDFFQEGFDCEYGYIINLDTMTLDLFKGFQKAPQKDNYLGTTQSPDGSYPPKMVAAIPLSEVTAVKVIEAFNGEK